MPSQACGALSTVRSPGTQRGNSSGLINSPTCASHDAAILRHTIFSTLLLSEISSYSSAQRPLYDPHHISKPWAVHPRGSHLRCPQIGKRAKDEPHLRPKVH